MKTRECIERIKANRWVRIIALGLTAFIVFSYMYSRGVSPVWVAVSIVCFQGFFKFLYRIACLLVAAEMPYKSHNTSRNGAVHHGRLFLFPMFYESGSEGNGYKKEKGWRIQAWHTRNYRAKLANASFGRQGQALRFRKNHPHCAAVFFPKTLPYRKHLPPGPCSSTGCQSPSIHN